MTLASTGYGTGAAMFGCEGPVLGASEAAFFRDFDPFGFIVFARNVETPDQLRRLTGDLRNAVGREAIISVDQEGGRVQRMRAPHWREWLPPLDTVTKAGPNAARAMKLQAQIIASELRAVGIDSNCAPVGDVASDLTHPFLRNRCYSDSPVRVAEIALAVADGYLAGGVLPVMKHMPGHGRSHVDTHLDLPFVDANRDSLLEIDFAPFKTLSHLSMGMTAHLIFGAYDPDHPSTQSKIMVEVIRSEIGFDGLLITDDLNMQALKGTLYDRTALSMAAGADIALHCKGDLAEMQTVALAAGNMQPDTQRRAKAALAQRIAPKSVDIAALESEFYALMGTHHDG